ncbi:MAG: hypothetical protein SGI97_07410 [candidate division Zixibacteria bacterium]|nr:hypothetical protein [candidate division Zixibacteria bacterium]
MESKPHYNYHDVLWAPAKALSAKQIATMTLFLLLSLVVYNLFTYSALAVDYQPLSSAFSVYGLLPFDYHTFESSLARSVYYSGIGVSVFVIMLGMFAIAAFNIELIRGNRFMSIRQVLRFTRQRMSQIFLSELSIVLFVGFVIFLLFLFGLITRIPYLGDWLYLLFFIFPGFIITIFVIFILFVCVASILLLPAVSAAERQGETFTAILETFSIIIRQPIRWLGYTLYSLAAAKVSMFVFAYFAYRAVMFLVWSVSLGGGEKIVTLTQSGLTLLPHNSALVSSVFSLFPGVTFSFSVSEFARRWAETPAAYGMAVVLFIIFASVLGYGLAIIAAAQARGYAALRKIKDNHLIGDEQSLFFVDEHVNPEIVTSPIKTE